MNKLIIIKRDQPLYSETAKQKLLKILLTYPEKEFSLSDLAKEAKVAKANIGLILNNMHRYNLIEIIKLKSIWRIKANQSNPIMIRNKIVLNLSLIYNSNLIDFLNERFKNPKAIVLFGSFRKGEDISTSDIDIAIESDEAKEYQTLMLRELANLEKEIGRKIQIHLFNRKNIDSRVFNNIANGIVLSGFLEVHP